MATACIEASVEESWKVLSSIEDISLWSEPVAKSFCSGKITRGVGAERTCILNGNVTIEEKWTHWHEGRSFTYQGYGIPLTKSAKNTWSVMPVNGKTLLTSEAEVEFKGGILGKLLEPLMCLMSKRMAANAMAAFKYLVENGKPYDGKHSLLQRAPVKC